MLWFVGYLPLSKVLVYTAIDVLVSSAAAAAVVAVGAHLEGKSVGASAYGMAIVTAIARSLLLSASVLPLLNLRFSYMYAFAHIAVKLLLATGATAAISYIVLGYVPGKLVAAALIGAIPWLGEDHTVYLYAFANTGDGIIEYSFAYPISWPGFDMLVAIFWDALAGFVFGQAAQGLGFNLFSPRTSTAAGAVFGALVGIALNIYNLIIMALNGDYEQHGYLVEQYHAYDGYIEEQNRISRQNALEIHGSEARKQDLESNMAQSPEKVIRSASV